MLHPQHAGTPYLFLITTSPQTAHDDVDETDETGLEISLKMTGMLKKLVKKQNVHPLFRTSAVVSPKLWVTISRNFGVSLISHDVQAVYNSQFLKFFGSSLSFSIN